MHENIQKALRLIEELIASQRETAFDVVYSDFPDRDDGPAKAYEARIARDDWAPLAIVVGRSHSSSHEMDDDPWSYERKDA